MESIEFKKANVFSFINEVNYNENSIVSKIVIKKEAGNVSLFAFDQGQSLSEHTAPFDALIQIVDGEAEIVIGGIPHLTIVGESIIMPANIPHAVKAIKKFKMILTMIKSK